MLSRRVWSRATPVIAQMMITRISLGCLLDDIMVRPVVLAQLHLHRDPALLAILEHMRQDEARQAQETAATFAQFQARQDKFQRQQ